MFARGCANSIFMSPARQPGQGSFETIGAVTFVGLAEAREIRPEELQTDAAGALTPLKFVTVVSGFARGPVRVSISSEDRAFSRLVYDPAQWQGRIRISDAADTVVFEVCEGKDTQYNGGFIVDGPRCITVHVIDEGSDQRAVEASVPFGLDTCPAG